ncbi:MAG: hypothetical protein NC821_00690 [Candidatus Omnitrophica bacterium]|nr:hypothetical protein [Candidatus Omnitrophota bacterium]
MLAFSQEMTLRNPFESWFHIKEREESKQREKESALQRNEEKPKNVELQLQGILSGKRNLAIINQEILGEGEVIAGRKIVRIEKKRVLLRELNNGEEIILQLTDEF